jgi:hypothetical protein
VAYYPPKKQQTQPFLQEKIAIFIYDLWPIIEWWRG